MYKSFWLAGVLLWVIASGLTGWASAPRRETALVATADTHTQTKINRNGDHMRC